VAESDLENLRGVSGSGKTKRKDKEELGLCPHICFDTSLINNGGYLPLPVEGLYCSFCYGVRN
jgi:hypothetical protein